MARVGTHTSRRWTLTDDARLPSVQIAEDLRAQIAAGTLQPGNRLPAGRELAEQYGVALMTVQRATTMLKGDGLLVAQQGRGTFVTSGDPTRRKSLAEPAAISHQIGDFQDLVDRTAQRLEARPISLEDGDVKPTPRSRRPRDSSAQA